jgi:hypothetical protein
MEFAMKCRFISVGLALALSTHFGFAQVGTVVGVGSQPCADYLAARARDARSDGVSESAMHVGWAQGFMTGANQARFQAGRPAIVLPVYNTLIYQLEKACRDDPAQSFHNGVIDVWALTVDRAK